MALKISTEIGVALDLVHEAKSGTKVGDKTALIFLLDHKEDIPEAKAKQLERTTNTLESPKTVTKRTKVNRTCLPPMTSGTTTGAGLATTTASVGIGVRDHTALSTEDTGLNVASALADII